MGNTLVGGLGRRWVPGVDRLSCIRVVAVFLLPPLPAKCACTAGPPGPSPARSLPGPRFGDVFGVGTRARVTATEKHRHNTDTVTERLVIHV